MPKSRILLILFILPLISGCAAIDAFLFDAYPDGTPINQSKSVERESPATEPALSPAEQKQRAEAEAWERGDPPTAGRA